MLDLVIGSRKAELGLETCFIASVGSLLGARLPSRGQRTAHEKHVGNNKSLPGREGRVAAMYRGDEQLTLEAASRP